MFSLEKNYNKIFFLFVKVIFSLIIFYLFYSQIQKLDFNSTILFQPKHPIFLFFTLLLTPVNLGLEYVKWNLCITSITKSNIKTRIISFFAGQITGFITPNLIGNFIGRLYYYPKSIRTKIIAYTTISNVAQFSISLIFGLVSLHFIGFKSTSIPYNYWIIVFVILFGLFLYFKLEDLVKSIPIAKLKTQLETKIKFRIKGYLLVLSILRHLVFSTQFILLLLTFGISFDINMFFWIWQVYFWSTLTPNLFFGKLIVRESIALWFLTYYISDGSIILLSSVLLWFINQGIPNLISLFIIKTKQIESN